MSIQEESASLGKIQWMNVKCYLLLLPCNNVGLARHRVFRFQTNMGKHQFASVRSNQVIPPTYCHKKEIQQQAILKENTKMENCLWSNSLYVNANCCANTWQYIGYYFVYLLPFDICVVEYISHLYKTKKHAILLHQGTALLSPLTASAVELGRSMGKRLAAKPHRVVALLR